MSRTLLAFVSVFVIAPATAASAPHAAAAIGQATPASIASVLQKLSGASQALQQTIEAMTHASTEPARERAMQDTTRLLLEAQKTLANLPADLVPAATRESDYDRYVKTLEQVTQTLRQAIRALDAQPADRLRDAAIREADAALIAAQETMMSVPSPIV